jgi:hypothetical protein
MQTNAEAARETPQTETIPEATPSMQTNADVARETPQTETIPEAAPSTQTNAQATRETPQTETIPEAAPSTQTNAQATRETPQTETIPEATPSMQRVITRQGANVRDAPTSSTVVRHASRRLGRRNDLPRTTVLRTVPRGTVLQVFARRDGWIQVGQDVPMGWVYSSLLTDAP